MNDGRTPKKRRVSTAVDGSDLPVRHVTERQQTEAANELRRKALQEYKKNRSLRRFVWQERLGRRALRVEEEYDKRGAF